MNVRCRNATIVGGLLLSCSLMFGAWTQLSPGIFGAVYHGTYFLPGQTQVGYVCGSVLDTSHMPPQTMGLVVKTTDGGTTWTSTGKTNTGSVLLSVYFLNQDTGFACGLFGTVVRTFDGGGTWARDSGLGGNNDALNHVQFPQNTATGYCGGTNTAAASRVYKTTDMGNTWTAMNAGPPIGTGTSCAMIDDNNGIAVGLNDLIWATTDGFSTGKKLNPQLYGSNLAAGAWCAANPLLGYVVGTDTTQNIGVIAYASNGVSTTVWDSVRCPVDTNGYDCVTFANAETAYVGGANGYILGSENAHDFWRTSVPLSVTGTISSICFPNGGKTGYAITGSIILKTTDAGALWVPGVAEGKAPALLLTGIRVVSNPCRFGIKLRSDENVTVTVFDATGRTVLSQTAVKGENFLPLRRAGAYFVRNGAQTVRAVVTD